MGARGPLPKRSEARTRRNKEGEDGIALKKGVALPYHWPEPSDDWDEAVVRFYDSLADTGMAAYYQQSDVEYAWVIFDEFARYRNSEGRARSAMQFANLVNAMNGLGITEGERRRMHIELDTPVVATEDDPSVVAIADWKQRLGKTG